MKVSHLMTSQVITLDPDDDLALAERLMKESNIRHMPVVDEAFRLVGLITQRDLLRSSLSDLHSASDTDRRMKESVEIADVMRDRVETVRPSDDLEEVANRMRKKKYGCMPVTDEDNHLIGIITETDFLRFSEQVLHIIGSAELEERLAPLPQDIAPAE